MGSRHDFDLITKCERDDRRPGRRGNVSGFCIEVWHEVVYGEWLIGELRIATSYWLRLSAGRSHAPRLPSPSVFETVATNSAEVFVPMPV